MSRIVLKNEDCLVAMDRMIDKGIKVDAVICDPPYGTTQCKWDTIIPLDEMWDRLKKIIKPNGAIVLFGSEPFSSLLRVSNLNMFKYDWVWAKNLKTGNLNAKRMPMGGHEMIHVFCKKSPTYNPQKRKRTTEIRSGNKRNSKTSVYGKQSDIYIDNQSDMINPDTVISNIKCVHNSSGKLHPTQKPVELIEYLVNTYTDEEDLVLDFTMGSGTTGVACKNLNRDFIGIELDEKYFEIAKDRIGV